MPVKAKLTPEDREAVRMGKDPFETSVPPDSEETIDHLRGWIPPLRNAYILWEAHVIHTRDEGVFERGTRLLTMDVEYQPEQMDVIQYYLAKGYKILHYGNFPMFNDPDQERARKAVMYSQGKGKSPWDELKAFLDRAMRRGSVERDNVKLKGERDALLAKVAEYERKEAAKAAKSQKDDASKDASKSQKGDEPTKEAGK